MRYYLGETPLKEKHAGSKARTDTDRIVSEFFSEFTHIEIKSYSSKFQKILDKVSPKYLAKLSKILFARDKQIFLQYPFYFDKITNKIIKQFAIENDTILLLHDVDSLRDFGEISVKKEIEFFNKTSGLIVHNEFMKMGLEKLGVTVKMTELKLFDYLLDDAPKIERKLSKVVAFPGNLIKSEFLKDGEIENISVNFHLYGGADPKFGAKNLTYMGGYSPEIIPHKLTESFGLIWDGNTIKTCSGAYGEYLKYNNPHKLSLYVASKLPVIAWEESAVAKFVTEQNIGITVKNLCEIPEKIDALVKADYDKFLTNLEPLQEKVIKGEFLKDAIKKL